MKDHTTTPTTTTTTGADTAVAAHSSSPDETNSHHHSNENSNSHRQFIPKFSLSCQLRGLIVRGMLIDTSKGSVITFGVGVFLIVICWVLLGVSAKNSSNLSTWWHDESYLAGQLSLLSFCPFFIGTMTKIGYETLSGFKDLMITMGLKMDTYYLYWILHELVLWAVVTITLSAIMYPTAFGGIEDSSFFTPVVWFGILFLNSIPSNFFLCSIVTSTKYQILFGIIWFYTTAYLANLVSDGEGNITAKVALGFIPATNFAIASRVFAAYLHPSGAYVDPNLRGLHVKNWGKIVGPEDLVFGTPDVTTNISIGGLFLVSVASLCTWSFIAFWLVNVQPFNEAAGDRREPLFFLKYLRPLEWCRTNNNEQSTLQEVDPDIVAADESVVYSKLGVPVQPIPSELQASVRIGGGVCIRKIRKTYDEINAVDNLTLTMFPGQVTGLLGHNGAGKTTTISCLTGALSISGGDIYVKGRSMQTHVREIRQMIGICPQKNVLHCDLTVEQHLQVDETLCRLSLEEKRSSLAKTLSGGQKRKLHVGIAFSGNSTVIFLDEPTAGMDPHTRRSTWETIQDYRRGRVIVLCSHYMDEMELLADRVAIMSKGTLQCVGSPLFLKRIYGVGYNLTLVGEPGDNGNVCGPARFRSWITAIRKHISQACIVSTHGSEAQIRLPESEEAKVGLLSLLRFIESNRENMGVVHYTLNSTTLEEVYLCAARGDRPKPKKPHQLKDDAPSEELTNSNNSSLTEVESYVEGENIDSSEFMSEGLIELPQKDKPFAGSIQLPLRQIRAIISVRLATRFRRGAEIFWGFIVPLALYIILIVLESLEGQLKWKWVPVTAGNAYGALLSLGIYFTVMPLGAFCVEDRVRGIKTQQILMGVKRSTYWIGLFICDYAIAFFLVITAIIGLAAAQSPTLRHEGGSISSAMVLAMLLAPAPLAWSISKAANRVTGTTQWDSDLDWVPLDHDVQLEKERAMGDESKRSALALQEVRKIYPGQVFPSVRDVSLVVEKGECFGLLGVNGAGKSTTMGMISTTVMPSSGNVLISGEEIYDKPELLAKHLGYCPQFDALWDHVTPCEHLNFCARCRGYDEEDIVEVVDSLIKLLGLESHKNKYSKHLSGGNKRKLSLAMAVLGNPTIVLLDEPSAGVDPVARLMWRVLSAASRNSAIILTSHSMEAVQLKMQYSTGYKIDVMVEVASVEEIEKYASAAELPLEGSLQTLDDLEAVLTKVIPIVKDCIMIGVIGKMLSNEEGPGNTGTTISALEFVSFACNADRRQRTLDFMFTSFPESKLAEAQGTRLSFYTEDNTTSLADMVETIQNRPDDVSIESFALGQTTLEQVFNMFAAQAAAEAEVIKNACAASSTRTKRSISTVKTGRQPANSVFETAAFSDGDVELGNTAEVGEASKHSGGTLGTTDSRIRGLTSCSLGLMHD